MGVDNTGELGFLLDDQGTFTLYKAADGSLLTTIAATHQHDRVKSVERSKNNVFTLLWEDNSITVAQVDFHLRYTENGERTVQPEIVPMGEYPARHYPDQALDIAIRSHEGRLTQVALLANNQFQIEHEVVTTDIFDNEKKETFSVLTEEKMPGKFTAFFLDEKGETLFAGTDNDSLLRWDLRDNTTCRRTDNEVR
jgi:phosphate transport system permease protein